MSAEVATVENSNELSCCPACKGRPRRERKVACSAGTTFRIFICHVCDGSGLVERSLARELWCAEGMKGQA